MGLAFKKTYLTGFYGSGSEVASRMSSSLALFTGMVVLRTMS
jgi:hypothetical protein